MWQALTTDERIALLRQHVAECILIDHAQRGVLLLMGIEQQHAAWWLTGFEDADVNGLCCLRLERIRECLVEEPATYRSPSQGALMGRIPTP